MRKLFTRIILVLAMFFSADRLLGWVLGQLYDRSNATDEYKVSYSNLHTRDSVLFMGSSRCLHHYVPSVMEKELGLSCFNAGDWGIKNIYYQYGLLSNILSRYTPQTIVLEVHPSEWLKLPFSGPERAGSLAPFCGMSEGCDEMLRLQGKLWAYRLSTVYRYTGALPNLITGPWGPMDRGLKGWKPLHGQMDTTQVHPETYHFEPDSTRMALMDRFAHDCSQRHIRLVIAVSPMYVCTTDDAFAWVRQWAARHHLPYLDHYRDTAFVGHSQLFYDFGHLNSEGALCYSHLIANELKQLGITHQNVHIQGTEKTR